MRRIQPLLIAAALAMAPASAVASSFHDVPSSPFVERVEWSIGKGRLGVMVMSMTPELRKHFGAADDRGVLVARVEPGTPAASAGIAVGDVITDVRGQKIEDASDVPAALSGLGKGERVEVVVARDRKPVSLQVIFAEREAPSLLREWLKAFEPTPPAPSTAPEWLRRLRELMRPARPAQTAHR